MNRGTQRQAAYRENAVRASTPEQFVPLLYEGLLAQLRRGARQIRDGNIEGKSESVSRASDIVHELLASLDFERGGEIAPPLASLYAFWIREIGEAGRTMDAARLEALEPMVSSLCGAWRTVSGHGVAAGDA